MRLFLSEKKLVLIVFIIVRIWLFYTKLYTGDYFSIAEQETAYNNRQVFNPEQPFSVIIDLEIYFQLVECNPNTN